MIPHNPNTPLTYTWNIPLSLCPLLNVVRELPDPVAWWVILTNDEVARAVVGREDTSGSALAHIAPKLLGSLPNHLRIVRIDGVVWVVVLFFVLPQLDPLADCVGRARHGRQVLAPPVQGALAVLEDALVGPLLRTCCQGVVPREGRGAVERAEGVVLVERHRLERARRAGRGGRGRGDAGGLSGGSGGGSGSGSGKAKGVLTGFETVFLLFKTAELYQVSVSFLFSLMHLFS